MGRTQRHQVDINFDNCLDCGAAGPLDGNKGRDSPVGSLIKERPVLVVLRINEM